MNIVFYILIILTLAVLYFALSSMFGFIGRITYKAWNEFKNNISDEEGEKVNGEE